MAKLSLSTTAVALAAAAIMAAPLLAHGKCAQFACNFATNIAHITQQHCQGTYGKTCTGNESRFTDTICTAANPATALNALCQEMLKDVSCKDSASGQGRTVATAVLDAYVGRDAADKCKETAKFAVVYDKSNGTVVTAYPGHPAKSAKRAKR